MHSLRRTRQYASVPRFAGPACDATAIRVGAAEIRELRDRFREGIRDLFGDRVTRNGHPAKSLPNTLNVNFVGRSGAEILAALPGVAASTGSACHAGSVTLSPVPAAMGVPPKVGMGAVRFSLGRATSWEELEEALRLLRSAVA